MIGTCGGAGGEPHLALVVSMAREIAREDGLHFKMATDSRRAGQSRCEAPSRRRDGSRPLAHQPPLTDATIDRATRMVGDDGTGTVHRRVGRRRAGRVGRTSIRSGALGRRGDARAIASGAGLVCGQNAGMRRDAIHPERARLPVRHGAGRSCRMRADQSRAPLHAVVDRQPLLHENSSPIHHIEPGGMLDTSDCRFEAVSDRAVRISGMRWNPAERYTVKLEGVELAGYRSICVCGTRDPLLIGRLDDFIDSVRPEVATKAAAFGAAPDSYQLGIRVYGRDGVMGAREPVRDAMPHELGFVIEVVSRDSQEMASAVLGMARTNMLHTDFPGRLCREGNMAFPFSPSDIEVGPVYRFSVYHVAELDDPASCFRSSTKWCDMALIRDVAKVCKSKNAGPFELTIDVVFEDAETFRRVQGDRRAVPRRCSPASTTCRSSTCCSPRMTRRSLSRRRCPGWCRRAISATPMSMAASSMPRCWMSIFRSESETIR